MDLTDLYSNRAVDCMTPGKFLAHLGKMGIDPEIVEDDVSPGDTAA